jgi:hypothetical protein
MRVRIVFASLAVAFLVSLSVPGARSAPAPAGVPVLPAALLERMSWSEDPEPLARLFRLRAPHEQPPLPLSATRASRPARRATTSALTVWGDVAIAASASLTETRPSVAANPAQSRVVAAGYGAFTYPSAPRRRCVVVRSADGGLSFSPPAFLPVVSPASTCNDVALAWSPNGRRLYAAYRDVRDSAVTLPAPEGRFSYRVRSQTDLLVSRSDDGGLTWTGPFFALRGDPWGVDVLCPPPEGQEACETFNVDPGTSFERPAISTPLDGGGSQVYVTATRFAEQDPAAPPQAIVFARSTDGASWSAPVALDEGAAGPRTIVVQGGRVVGGSGGEVLAAWYHSGDDGFLEGSFEIRVRRSRNRGQSWDPVVVAARDADEAPAFLGPLAYYKLWWPTMFPDVAIDRGGRAHLVYGHDPEPGSLSAEEGDVRYVTSAAAPFTAWSAPATLNDDALARAQGFAALTVRADGRLAVVDVVWEDTRLSPDLPLSPSPDFHSPNLLYDVFHARWLPAGGWSANRRVSGASSTQDRFATGARVAVTANAATLYAAWTDRRAYASVDDRRHDVYGNRIVAGSPGGRTAPRSPAPSR